MLQSRIHIKSLPILKIQKPLESVCLIFCLLIDIRLFWLLGGSLNACHHEHKCRREDHHEDFQFHIS